MPRSSNRPRSAAGSEAKRPTGKPRGKPAQSHPAPRPSTRSEPVRQNRDSAPARTTRRRPDEPVPAGRARPERPVVPTARRSAAAPRTDTAPQTPSASQKLQKVLAQAGLGSRREMEELIQGGKVLVNGQPATLGMRVEPDDEVKVGRRQIRFKLSARLPRVIVYHKPEGEIVTRSDPQGRTSVFEKLPVIRSGKWLAIGRLDYNTCGLLVFTTSGELANRLTHPRFEVEREYAVRIMGEVNDDQGRAMLRGVQLDDGEARFDLLAAQGGTGSNHWYRVVVREGRNRLVRRMFEHFGLQVSRLMRVRFGIINLPPRLKRGQHLELTEAQTRSVLEWLARGGEQFGDIPLAPPAAKPAKPPARAARPAKKPSRAPARPGSTTSGRPRRRSR